MSKKSPADNVDEPTATTEATLVSLSKQINEFVREGTLDSRFAAKLAKRLKKEAETISESGKGTKPGQNKLQKAFDALDVSLRDHDAKLLVAANAALRTSDDVAGVRKSP
ncbi:hypothetical protein B0G76_4605 [Paraburkholderia sp. BL23I1N1]|uniref:hypothetical protein n=1 Tax=Paraburkholderia sp. BL23I1N1 TaxID=1938802 RepID=UPI000E70E53C|nr:hypothetical protein [Paraburkholderia sp. BL23I1N1]RKE38294.1 hypothetical protein B0G76_4605 [Paraburkholderia sp. BL23I1N1]